MGPWRVNKIAFLAFLVSLFLLSVFLMSGVVDAPVRRAAPVYTTNRHVWQTPCNRDNPHEKQDLSQYENMMEIPSLPHVQVLTTFRRNMESKLPGVRRLVTELEDEMVRLLKKKHVDYAVENNVFSKL